jgi:hypothetical protein
MSKNKVLSYSFGNIIREDKTEYEEFKRPDDIGTKPVPNFSNVERIRYNPNFRKKKKNNKSKSHKKEFDKLFNDDNTN